MTVTINAVTSTGLVQTSDGSGIIKVQSNGVATNALAWCNFNGTLSGTITPRANYNINSVTKNGTGDYTLNFTNALSDANYSAVLTSGETTGDNNANSRIIGMTTSTLRIAVKNGSFVYTDYGVNNIAIFGN